MTITGALFPTSVAVREEVDVYDSLYRTVSSHTLRIIASLVFSSASQLVVRMKDVERQSNGSDCGVLVITFAYNACDPCIVRFDHKSIRQHLADCLEKCSLSRFPIAGKRRSSKDSGGRFSQNG